MELEYVLEGTIYFDDDDDNEYLRDTRGRWFRIYRDWLTEEKDEELEGHIQKKPNR